MPDGKEKTAILVAASIICAVRTARDEIKPSPKVQAAIADSIRLAKMLWERLSREQ